MNFKYKNYILKLYKYLFLELKSYKKCLPPMPKEYQYNKLDLLNLQNVRKV